MLLFLGLFMICSFVKMCKESEVTHLFMTMQPNVFVCLKFFRSVSTGMLTSVNECVLSSRSHKGVYTWDSMINVFYLSCPFVFDV